MNTIIRKAQVEDAEAFIAIKNQLPITLVDGETTTGGFLLGTDVETYRSYIETEYCLVAELNSEVIGFGIILSDKCLRESDVWEKRYDAKWNIDLSVYEEKRLCYFEQLAFLKGNRKSVLILAYNLVKWVFDKGYDTLFTTTVNKPILNLAAIPFIHAVSGIKAGNIDEVYPLIGQINSDIYLIEAEVFYEKVLTLPLSSFFQENTLSIF